ncbi:Protein sym1 [Tetrabaena socialis]|uniref:Protein sym1 n=1 Tax=Tetrabaena socialis TaxID=47790 RepID=A0A2J7ZI29_9CHLO|nr:Protein sym1 [Tetrabaena socialis]|eukprot:PNG99930.1 Protein sym1 [Tetrabaena socialis]
MGALGRALKAPFIRFGRAYNETAQKYPFSTGVLTTVVKTSAADLFAQKVMERREEVDWRRHGMFVAFGFGYLGCWQFYLYNDLFVRWCKPLTALVGHVGSAPIKTFIDQCIHHPLLYFPCFYSLKGMVEGRPWADSMADCHEHLWENCKALWMIWVPAQMINFTVVPLHLRIPFVAGVSFAWTVVISCMRGALDKTPPARVEGGSMGPSAVADADAAASSGVARTSTISLQPLLNASTASADSQDSPVAAPPPVGLAQLISDEVCDPASAPLLLR